MSEEQREPEVVQADLDEYCCDAFANRSNLHHNAGGAITENDDGTYNVNGCCGPGCHVLFGLIFCPWCCARQSRSSTCSTCAGCGRVAQNEERTPEEEYDRKCELEKTPYSERVGCETCPDCNGAGCVPPAQ